MNAFMQKYPNSGPIILGLAVFCLLAADMVAYNHLVSKPAQLAAQKQAEQRKLVAENELTRAVYLTGPKGNAQILQLSYNPGYVIAGHRVQDVCELYRRFDWEQHADGRWIVWERKYFPNRYTSFPSAVREVVLNRPRKF